MMFPPESKPALKLVAKAALSKYEELSPDDRILLIQGLALILPEAESQAATQTAWILKKSQEQQLIFQHLIDQL